jgi:O-antigen/teichoic acid export membrane protein
LILVLQTVITLVGSVALIGVMGFGVAGAVATSVVVNAVVTIGVMAEVARLARRDKAGQSTSMRALSAYAARVYPASITGYFNYRADTYIIQAVSASKTAADHSLGLYGIAVTMAEIVFYVPESVSTMFLPRVAAGSH